MVGAGFGPPTIQPPRRARGDSALATGAMQEPAWGGGAGSQAADKVANNLAYLSVYDAQPPNPGLDPYAGAGRPDANGWLGPVSPGGPAQRSSAAGPGPASPGPHHRTFQQNHPLSVGWGGQAIPDSPGFRVPWFGRSRGKGAFPSRGRGRGRGAGFDRGRRNVRRGWNAADERLAEEEGLSVEEVVSLISGLPQGHHIPETAYQALFQFDSRAAALLLKDLSKAGLGFRAVELFDWLRKLEEGHPLHSLCDVYTYTAMISMCIYQQVCAADFLVEAVSITFPECADSSGFVSGPALRTPVFQLFSRLVLLLCS